MKKSIIAVMTVVLLSILPAGAVELKTTVWDSYGVSFSAPADIIVEDDSEEGYSVSNSDIFITIQILTGDGMSKESISEDLRNIASEDQLTDTTSISKLDLQHFDVAYLRGKCETDKCLYSYLLAKDGSCGFYLSIIYGNEKEETVEEILKSFKLSE